MTEIKRENYINIQGWMITDLNLKGNELLIYGIIYGFSQNAENRFTGSLGYLAAWTNSTKQGVIKCLKALVEKGYIVKIENIINGVKFCEYYSTELNEVLNKVERGIKQSLTGGSEQSLPNNIDSYNLSNNQNNIYIVVAYLNEKAGTKYKETSKTTQKLIKARLNESFTVDDFKTVIDKKAAEWKGSDMEKYLRPSTLFGTKFEEYLNSKIHTPKAGAPINESKNDLDDLF